MDYKVLFGFVAVLFGILSYVSYYRDVLHGKTKPHLFSWLIWGIGGIVIFIAQRLHYAGPGAWLTGISTIGILGIAILSFWFGEKDITKTDTILFFGALSGIILWIFFDNILWSVVIITTVDFIGFIPTFLKTYKKPHQETSLTFYIGVPMYACSLIALQTYSVVTVLYPFIMLVLNAGLAMFITVLQKRSR